MKKPNFAVDDHSDCPECLARMHTGQVVLKYLKCLGCPYLRDMREREERDINGSKSKVRMENN